MQFGPCSCKIFLLCFLFALYRRGLLSGALTRRVAATYQEGGQEGQGNGETTAAWVHHHQHRHVGAPYSSDLSVALALHFSLLVSGSGCPARRPGTHHCPSPLATPVYSELSGFFSKAFKFEQWCISKSITLHPFLLVVFFLIKKNRNPLVSIAMIHFKNGIAACLTKWKVKGTYPDGWFLFLLIMNRTLASLCYLNRYSAPKDSDLITI